MQDVQQRGPDDASNDEGRRLGSGASIELAMTYGFRLLAATLIGTGVGVLMAVVHVVLHVAAGGLPSEDGKTISAAALAAVDIAGGFMTGALAGLLQQLRTTLLGATVIGMVSVAPWTLGIGLLYGSKLDQAGVTSFLMITVLVGGGLGAYFGQAHRRNP